MLASPSRLPAALAFRSGSAGRYVSSDLDFIEEGPVPRRHLRQVLAAIGFEEKNRYFIHPDTEFFVEFPTGPLMVGDERIIAAAQRRCVTGTLRLLSPIDCVKDRLAAFFITGTIGNRWSRP